MESRITRGTHAEGFDGSTGEYARGSEWVAWGVLDQHRLAEEGKCRVVAACRRSELNEAKLNFIKTTMVSLTRHLAHRCPRVHGFAGRVQQAVQWTKYKAHHLAVGACTDKGLAACNSCGQVVGAYRASWAVGPKYLEPYLNEGAPQRLTWPG